MTNLADAVPKTILITGASTGIGKATAEFFAAKGWNVAATMRTPNSATFASDAGDRLKIYALDVTDQPSIDAAVASVIADFGRIDVVVNNAGYGLVGLFEAMTPEQIRRNVDTNLIGVMNVTRAVLPHMRAQRSGYVVTVASVAGRLSVPLYTLYCATKWAVEGFTEALNYEVCRFGIKVRIIEPGPIKSDFLSRSLDVPNGPVREAYGTLETDVQDALAVEFFEPPGADLVAASIYKSVTAWPGWRIRYKPNGWWVMFGRKVVPSWFHVYAARRLFNVVPPLLPFIHRRALPPELAVQAADHSRLLPDTALTPGQQAHMLRDR